MKTFNYSLFRNMSDKDIFNFVLENKIFKLRSKKTYEDIYMFSLPHKGWGQFLDSTDIIPCTSYLNGIYHLMMKQLEDYENGTITGTAERYYKIRYSEILEFSFDLKDHIKIAKKIRKKIIKSIKYCDYPFTGGLTPERNSFKKTFREFWFNDDESEIEMSNFYVNNDVFMYAISDDTKSNHFDCNYLKSFVDLSQVVSTYKALDFFDAEIKILKSIPEEEYNFLSNIKFNIVNSINRHDLLFYDPYSCELFLLCIKKEVNLTARKLNIYWHIFYKQNFRKKYHGVDTEFISFCKKEFNIKISRVEKDIPRNIDLEMASFKKNQLLISSILQ